jgi:predicted HNH restriction endonuclease
MAKAPTKAQILKRIAEYNKDEKAFLKRYANRNWSRDWFIAYEDNLYDAKALWGASFEPPIKTKDLNTRDARAGFKRFPEFELISLSETDERTFREGKRRLRETYYFVRNAKLVEAAKEKYGTSCMACNFNFEKQYGQHGIGYIEVHHLHQMKLDKERDSRVEDVVVLCSNCHQMIEKTSPPLTLAGLKDIVKTTFA